MKDKVNKVVMLREFIILIESLPTIYFISQPLF